MKRACSLNTNKDENFTCGFHPAIKTNYLLMKRIALALAILLTPFLSNAQENNSGKNDEVKTLFGKNKDAKIGWFIGFDNGYTQFGSRDVFMSGFNAGFIVDHNLTIGFSGSGWTNRDRLYYHNLTATEGAYLEGGFGGVLIEYTPQPKSAVHLTFPFKIGFGGASYVTDTKFDIWDGDEWDFKHKTLDSDAFFSFEPGVRVEVNALKFIRLSGGVSYRKVNGLNLINTPTDLMNNFTFNCGVKFGKF
jgi:hypothetical protein